MASKRLSKLKSNELEPSEKGLADEEGQELNLNGVLSVTTEDDLKIWETANKLKDLSDADSDNYNGSVDSASGEESNSDEYNSDDNMPSIDQLPTTSISRGLSILVIRQRKTSVKFDIIDTRIVGRRKKYVLYRLVVTQTPGLDSDKAFIERRYSDFYTLRKELKKMFPAFIKTLDFPQKKMYGNLDSSLISTRCQMLQKFVQESYGKEEIRTSDTFKKFFYTSSLQKGCQYICGGSFEEALMFLLNGLHLQQKLALDSSNEVIETLCNIVECYMSLENYEEVVKYSQAALELLQEESISDIYVVPLLQTLKDAYAILGRNTNEVERRLKEVININQIEVDHVASLRELAVKRFTKI